MMTADEQEALSKKYGNGVIILLPLSSGNVAVFNSARELCGIVDRKQNSDSLRHMQALWFPPKKQEEKEPTAKLLKNLGLL